MRALTLTQPWAGLVASGIKLVENRPRRMIKPTDFGQRFAIHASREVDLAVYDRIREIAPDLYAGDMPVAERPWHPLTRITSAIIGVAEIVRAVDDYDTLDAVLGAQRRWYFGPIGYVLSGVRALPEPVPCKGMLGFWRMKPEVAARVEAQLR